MTPPVEGKRSFPSPSGSGCHGYASCHLTPSARRPPIMNQRSDEKRNWIPMILWSCEKMYFPRKVVGPWS
jgi:hypothetical protein